MHVRHWNFDQLKVGAIHFGYIHRSGKEPSRDGEFLAWCYRPQAWFTRTCDKMIGKGSAVLRQSYHLGILGSTYITLPKLL